jgi:hypothetical protein
LRIPARHAIFNRTVAHYSYGRLKPTTIAFAA